MIKKIVAALFGIAAMPCSGISQNPIIQTVYTADPAPHAVQRYDVSFYRA